MKIFTCTDHEGHWPVGVASVVVAETKEDAKRLLIEELQAHGLKTKAAFNLREINTDDPKAFVLNDGNY